MVLLFWLAVIRIQNAVRVTPSPHTPDLVWKCYINPHFYSSCVSSRKKIQFFIYFFPELTPSEDGDVEARVTLCGVTGRQTEGAAPVVTLRVHCPAPAPRHWHRGRVNRGIYQKNIYLFTYDRLSSCANQPGLKYWIDIYFRRLDIASFHRVSVRVELLAAEVLLCVEVDGVVPPVVWCPSKPGWTCLILSLILPQTEHILSYH